MIGPSSGLDLGGRPPTAPREELREFPNVGIGGEERTCFECGRPWEALPGQNCPCGSSVITEKYRAPVPAESQSRPGLIKGVFGRKAKVPGADRAAVGLLRVLDQALASVEEGLPATEAALGRLVSRSAHAMAYTAGRLGKEPPDVRLLRTMLDAAAVRGSLPLGMDMRIGWVSREARRVLQEALAAPPDTAADAASLKLLDGVLGRLEAALPPAAAASQRLASGVPAQAVEDGVRIRILAAKLSDGAVERGDTPAYAPLPVGRMVAGLRWFLRDALCEIDKWGR